MKSYKYILEGLDCANCAKKIEDKIANTKGYEQVNVNFSTLKLSFQTDKEDNVKQEITQIVHSLEPEVNVIDEKEKITENSERNNSDIFRLIIGVIIYVLGAYVSIFSNFVIITTIISLIILLSKTAKKAFTQVFKNKVLDENTLITISVIGACLVGKSMEGVMVIVLYEIGKILEARAVNKTRKSISDLMDIKPEYANLKNGEEVNLIMVYKVDKKLDKNKFILYYQELDNKPYLRKIKIDVEDLSKIVDMKVKSIGEEEKFSLGKSTKSVTFDSVDIGDSFTYSVQDCTNFSGCYTTSEEIAVDSSSKILKISFISDDFQGKEFIDFSVKYGKISYIDDKGNYLYIKVPLEVLNAKEINISYTIRNKRYVYKIK